MIDDVLLLKVNTWKRFCFIMLKKEVYHLLQQIQKVMDCIYL